MTRDRFKQIIEGPLSHPFPEMHAARLTIALESVVDAGGPKAERALEIVAEIFQKEDDAENEGEPPAQMDEPHIDTADAQPQPEEA